MKNRKKAAGAPLRAEVRRYVAEKKILLAPADVLAAKIILGMEKEKSDREWLNEGWAIARGEMDLPVQFEHLAAVVEHAADLERLLMAAGNLLKEGE